MTSTRSDILRSLNKVIPGPWETFEQLSERSYRLPLGVSTDLVLQQLLSDGRSGEAWQASFGDSTGEFELELSSPAGTPAEAVTELLGRARRLTLLTCRYGDRPQNLDELVDVIRGHIFGTMDAVLSKAGLERDGNQPSVLRSPQAAG